MRASWPCVEPGEPTELQFYSAAAMVSQWGSQAEPSEQSRALNKGSTNKGSMERTAPPPSIRRAEDLCTKLSCSGFGVVHLVQRVLVTTDLPSWDLQHFGAKSVSHN